MLNKFLTTTAIVALLATPALAQTTTTTKPMAPAGSSVFMPKSGAMPPASTNGFFSAYQGEVLASALIGKKVYANTGASDEAIGDVNDIVMSPDGRAEALIVGVGGFLGVGEREVAIDFGRVTWFEADGDTRLSIAATRAELENAPAFDRSAMDMENVAAVDASATTSTKPAAGTNAMAGAKTVSLDALSADKLIGSRVHDADNRDIGEIGDVLVTEDGEVEAYVIDVGGFLGIGEKQVALDATELTVAQNDDKLTILTPFTKAQLEAQPTYSADAYKTDRNSVVLR